jgi:hypothetical protein
MLAASRLPQLGLQIADQLIVEDDQLGAPELEGPVQVHALPVLPLPHNKLPPVFRILPPELVGGGVAGMTAGPPVVLGQHAGEGVSH